MSSALILLIALLAPLSSASAASGELQRVLDGDTIDVVNTGVVVRLRLAGIGAPELHSIVPCAERHGEAAKARVEALLTGQVLRYESLGADLYGRIIAMVFLGPVWMSEQLVREGLAVNMPSYPVSRADRKRLVAAEAEAIAAKRGLWGP